jgi:hypothetical protein
MRRVLIFCEFRATWWEERVTSRKGLSPDTYEGVRAYALRQAAIQRERLSLFRRLWSTPNADINNAEADDDSGEDVHHIDDTAGGHQSDDEDDIEDVHMAALHW